MKIDWLVPCRYAEPQADGTLMISGAGIDTFWVDESSLPTDLAFFLAARAIGELDELLAAHDIKVRLRRPSSKRAEKLISGQIQADRAPETAEMAGGVLLAIGMAFNARELGVHSVEFALDGRRRKVEFRVASKDSRPAVAR
jgi:hypothetical protein